MRRLLIVISYLISSSAWAAAILPGGGGNIQSLSQLGNFGCSLNDAIVWNGSAWICQGVGAGSGDNTQINGAASTDANIINTAGDGGISWTLNTAPAPDTFAAIVIDGAIAPLKLKSADFGDFTCAAGTCTMDNDTIALGTKTTGSYLLNMTATPPLTCTGCNAESATGLLSFDQTAAFTWTGRHDFSSGKLNTPNAGGAPNGTDCDAVAEYGSIYIDSGSGSIYACTSTGWKTTTSGALTGFAVDSVSQTTIDFQDGGDINFSAAAGVVTGDVKANSVALTTDTTGNYVASMAAGTGLTCTGCAATEGSTPSLAITAASVGPTEIASTAVTPGTYTCPSQAIVDQDGRITGMTSGTCGIVSTTVGFLVDGGAANLSAGGGQGGKIQVMDNGDLQYTDGNATPVLKTALHRDGASSFTANSIPVATGTGSEFTGSAATANAAGTITIPAGQTLAVTSGATISTSLDSPANSASGGALTLKEDSDLGSNTWAISIGATNLSGNFSITPAADGKLTASSLLTAATVTPTELSTAARVNEQCISIAAPSTSTDKILFRAETASTITGIDCVTTDGNTPITVQNGGANAAGSTTIEATMTCTTTNTTEAAGIDSPTLVAGDWVKLDVVAAVTTTGTVTLCVTYTPN